MKDNAPIMATLVEIEREFPVDRLLYRGVRVWPLVRHRIADEWLWNRTASQRQNESARQDWAAHVRRSRSNGEQAAALRAERERAVELALAACSGSCDALFVTCGFEYTRLFGAWYNRWFDPLKELLDDLGQPHLDLEAGFRGGDYQPKHRPTVDLRRAVGLSRGIAARNLDGPDAGEIEQFAELLGFLAARGHDFGLPCRELVAAAEEILELTVLFDALLERLTPQLVFLVCYFHPLGMALARACRRRGLPAIELQHSIISNVDWAWAQWARVPDGGYELLPERFWVWSEPDAEIVRHCFAPVVGGNPWLARWKGEDGLFEELPGPFAPHAGAERTILYTAPYGEEQVYADMLAHLFPAALREAVQRSPPGWRWHVRLHYKTGERALERVRQHLAGWSDRLHLHHADEVQLYSLFGACDVHVSQTSTTLIEAEAFGLPSIVIGEYGPAVFAAEIAAGHLLHAASGAELLRLIDRRSATTPRAVPRMLADRAGVRSALQALLRCELAAVPCADLRG